MERVVFSTNGAQTKRYPHATNRKKKKKDEWTSSKVKLFASKDIIKKIKRQSTEWEKNLEPHIWKWTCISNK